MIPVRIEVIDHRKNLRVTWEDGSASLLDARSLRAASRGAGEVRRRVDGGRLVPSSDLRLEAVETVGNYALRLAFSDGHDRGIYPWSYLRELAAQQAA